MRQDNPSATQPETPRPDGPRLGALDGLRGISILLVLIHHFCQFIQPRTALDSVVLSLASAGWIGVDLFFVLSGFLITGILYDTREAQNYFRSFYARRALRIFPLYYAFLILLYLVAPAFGLTPVVGAEVESWPWFFLYASNWLMVLEGWQSRYVLHFWSLAIEEQFYLVWPLFVFWLPRRALLGLAVAIIPLAALLRFAQATGGQPPEVNFLSTLTRADALAAGAVLALLFRGPSPRKLERWLPWLTWGLIGLAFWFLMVGGRMPAWHEWAPAQQAVGYTVVAVAAACVVAWTSLRGGDSVFNRFLKSSPLRMCGTYSYAMYVFHMPVDTWLRNRELHPEAWSPWAGSSTLSLLAYIPLASAATIGMSWLSWRYFEEPILRYKSRFRARFARLEVEKKPEINSAEPRLTLDPSPRQAPGN